MWFTHLTLPAWRTGATFVHDWLALALGVVLAGDIGMAMGDPEARRGMRTGFGHAGVGRAGVPALAALTESRHTDRHVRRGTGRQAVRSGRGTRPERPPFS
jgi:hypothetical protein